MLSSFVKLLTRFRQGRSGNLAIITALSIAPLMVAAGGITDVSMLLTTRDTAQSALDAATLNAAASSLTTESDLSTQTGTVFHAMVQNSMASDATVQSVTYDSNSHTLYAKATGTYQAKFGQLVGMASVPYTITSTATRAANGTLEVALVLDNTWSMSVALDSTGTKITVLKTAAQNLINQIMTTQNTGNVKVAVVPYADYVNVGKLNRNAAWMTTPADYTTTTPGSPAVPGGPVVCKTVSTKTTTTCTGGTPTQVIVSYTDGVPNYQTQMVGQTCKSTTVPITPYQSCSQSPAPKAAVAPQTTTYTFWGCAGNLVQSNGQLALPDPLLPYPGLVDSSQKCLNAIQPLTGDKPTAVAAVQGLVVNIGNYKPETYIPAGLVWGVNVLSPTAPFSEGAAYDPANKQPRKAIILMTDGSNTEYLQSTGKLATGNATQVAQTYKDQQAICDYAKSKKIEIYTIGFGVTDQTSLKALQACATDSSHYFDAESSGGLLAAFKTIAGSLSTVRIAG